MDNDAFVGAIKKTGRKKIVMSGITTDVCVAFAALSALDAGYEVYVAVDASGSMNADVQNASLMRMASAGATIGTWFGPSCELLSDWRNPAGAETTQLFIDQAASEAPPLRAILNAGVPLGAGTDATRVSSYNPRWSMQWLVTGQSAGDTTRAAPHNRLTRDEALHTYTVGSAWFSGEETVKGRIATGQFADFAVLSDDYFTVPEASIRDIESVLTVVAGRIARGTDAFKAFSPDLPAASPPWSPVAAFGGFQHPKP